LYALAFLNLKKNMAEKLATLGIVEKLNWNSAPTTMIARQLGSAIPSMLNRSLNSNLNRDFADLFESQLF